MNDAPNGLDGCYPLPAIDAGVVSEKESNPVRDKSFRFALKTIGLCRELQADREFVISKQLMRSGTGIGANVEEAISAESRKDFLHKIEYCIERGQRSPLLVAAC